MVNGYIWKQLPTLYSLWIVYKRSCSYYRMWFQLHVTDTKINCGLHKTDVSFFLMEKPGMIQYLFSINLSGAQTPLSFCSAILQSKVAPASSNGERKDRRLPFKGIAHLACAYMYWPELSHIVTPSCKTDWNCSPHSEQPWIHLKIPLLWIKGRIYSVGQLAVSATQNKSILLWHL